MWIQLCRLGKDTDVQFAWISLVLPSSAMETYIIACSRNTKKQNKTKKPLVFQL